MQSKRHPLAEVSANTNDKEAAPSAANDSEEATTIKILAPANNFLPSSNAHDIAPRGDNTPLTINDESATASLATKTCEARKRNEAGFSHPAPVSNVSDTTPALYFTTGLSEVH